MNFDYKTGMDVGNHRPEPVSVFFWRILHPHGQARLTGGASAARTQLSRRSVVNIGTAGAGLHTPFILTHHLEARGRRPPIGPRQGRV